MKKQKRKNFPFLFLGLILGISFFSFEGVLAFKEYNYDLISVNIKINPDSTVDIEEKLVFNYQGNFNKGWRNIPFYKISAISDIEVIDGKTNKPLVFSPKKLDKLDPNSWGKYTYYKEKNQQIIEWYYNLADTKYEWILKYKVHGAIGFYKDHDEFYWNLFSDYDVPVLKAEAFVKIPENNFSEKDFQIQFYKNFLQGIAKIINNQSFYFSTQDIPSHQTITIAVGWPKGLISQVEWWKDFVKIYLEYFLSLLVVFLATLIGFFYWFFTEKYNFGRGTIIPHYEPPQNLRPAMAELICKEKITNKTWPATIIDLAVRGYLRIKEDRRDWLEPIVFYLLLLNCLVFVFLSIFNKLGEYNIIFIFFLIVAIINWKKLIPPKNYIIEKTDRYLAEDLEDYEKDFLNFLFKDKDYFSTREFKRSPVKKGEFIEVLEQIKEKLYQETERDTLVFEKSLLKESKRSLLLGGIILALVILSWFAPLIFSFVIFSKKIFLISVILASFLGLYMFIKYEARLSKEGQILKEEWLGFKMYLETAEKYRMQNLTPEIFEKYLPYAMIFGIEKKWARAFQSLNVQPPSWYEGKINYSQRGGGFSGFSPVSFSASFSSAFISAFSGVRGGGGAGGGGRVGGGAGGGGGGAC